ncbi:MAG: helix-turn-helix transcriptional regulator [Marinobacter sp.]|uniref:helix-turn-helix domain-containing protein n=1 Tax=Marinobacter sp. TaxID=50741 RepID=UPI001B403FC1|nr:helix-turn-helix transcriptional regulator [Marinobacter sp.]MBQ0814926.1 helix-turn-helix transcriptional regulator [Marinobacter sp.]
MNLGNAIEECRKLKGVTKSRLAESAGISVSYLTLIVKGQREPTMTAIEKIASALGVPSSLLIFLASEDSEVASLSEGTKNELRALAKELIKSSADHPHTEVFR